MAFPDRRTSNVLLTILLFALVLVVLYLARRVLLIFTFAILFAYLINPVVRFLQGHSLFFKNLRGPHVGNASVDGAVQCHGRRRVWRNCGHLPLYPFDGGDSRHLAPVYLGNSAYRANFRIFP